MLPAMVLCAGFGTRLRPLTDQVPKPLLPVGDRPAVMHIFGILQGEFSPLVMNTHHQADAFLGQLPADVVVVHEPSILGTAGGVANAAQSLGAGDVIVWNGDIIAAPELKAVVESHRVGVEQHQTLATLLVRPLAPALPGQGTVGVDADGHVVRLRGVTVGHEATGADFAGIQILTPAARRRLPPEGCLVGDLYLPLLEQGEAIGIATMEGPWYDIGSPASLMEANVAWLRAQRRSWWACASAKVAPAAELLDSIVCSQATITGEGLVQRCLVLPGASLCGPAQDCIVMADGRVVSSAAG